MEDPREYLMNKCIMGTAKHQNYHTQDLRSGASHTISKIILIISKIPKVTIPLLNFLQNISHYFWK